jgi:glutamate carboxypeptidase
VTDRYLSRLTELCGIDSFTGDVAGVDRAAQLLAGWAREGGLEVELIPSADGLHLIAGTQGAGSGRVLLIGHHDTVFPPPTAVERPVSVVGERAFGPGWRT